MVRDQRWGLGVAVGLGDNCGGGMDRGNCSSMREFFGYGRETGRKASLADDKRGNLAGVEEEEEEEEEEEKEEEEGEGEDEEEEEDKKNDMIWNRRMIETSMGR